MKIRSFINNPCNLYFLFWILYLLQGSLYESGSMISQALLAVILLMSLKPVIDVIKGNNKPVYFKGLSTLVLMYVVYGVLLMIIDGKYTQGIRYTPPTYFYLKAYMISLLPIYTCYYYARQGKLNTEMFRKWVIIFVIVASVQYFREQRERLVQLINNDEVTNNSGYLFLSLLPAMLVYYNKVLIRYIGVGLCSVFVLMSMKRGAILILAFALFYFVIHELRISKGKTKVVVTILIVLSSLFLGLFIQNLVEKSPYFNQRIEQTMSGDDSNRSQIYSRLIDSYFNDATALQMLVGRGANGTLKIGGYAHQDWLEILTNQGLFGIIIFFVYWLLFWKSTVKGRFSYESRFALRLIFLITGLQTMFSMSIGDMPIYLSSVLGYSFADGFCHSELLSADN